MYMSNFRYIDNRNSKVTHVMNRETMIKLMSSDFVKQQCAICRAHDKKSKAYEDAKCKLPAALWLGFDPDGSRLKERMIPTGYFFIDLDKMSEDPRKVFNLFKESVDGKLKELGVAFVHETPSRGLRIVCRAVQDFTYVSEHLDWMLTQFDFTQYGDYDKIVKDLSRISFLVDVDWIIYEDQELLWDHIFTHSILNPDREDVKAVANPKPAKLPEITDKERNFEFEGKRVAEIAEEYIIDQGGVPEQGLRHAFYNDLIKNFRNICNNDPRVVFAILPLCEGEPEKRWSACTSICKTNNYSRIPRDFYIWLAKRGYVRSKKYEGMYEYMDSDIAETPKLPKFPPIFREFCGICPPDFVYPSVIALMPVMGTLTSYVRADYIDNSEQSTTFFSCIWAPPSSHKSFVKNIVERLMKKIRVRDEMNNIREQLYLIDANKKADNEKGIDLPHVMVRMMPAINSLPEFLEKMRDNRGYHMFTLAEEVDTFRKGSSSGGADKSDLFRTAWDNSEYGQSFKSTNTFKGTVKVYYNILLTGTPGAVHKYYSNVEDGMVTRISICEIENQQFAPFVAWKHLTPKQLEVIDRFVERCDKNTYADPIDMTQEDVQLYNTNSSDFDEHVKWKFRLQPKQKLDMTWIYPTILDWLEKQRKLASLDNDAAADVFRRRVGVKGFRLALVCMCCWDSIGKREKETIRQFVLWFMDRDLKESLKMFGQKYNDNIANTFLDTKHLPGLFDSLPETFTKNDVIAQCIKTNTKTKVKVILYRWRKDKAIDKIGENKYKKIKR